MPKSEYVLRPDKSIIAKLGTDYQFSDEPRTFLKELSVVMYLFVPPAKKVREQDAIAMSAAFTAGQIVLKLDQDGFKKRDNPSPMGKMKWKNRPSYQKIIEEAYRVEDRDKKKRNAICEEVRKAFINRGMAENKMYTTKTINYSILKDEWPELK